jgi:hypothetical protein
MLDVRQRLENIDNKKRDTEAQESRHYHSSAITEIDQTDHLSDDELLPVADGNQWWGGDVAYEVQLMASYSCALGKAI